MQRSFKSKIDKGYHFLIWGVLVLIFYFFWHRMIGAGISFLLLLVLMMESMLRTDYVITADGILNVKSGFFPRYKINIREIREVKYIRSNRPAYALSFDRLLIVTAYDNRMVSPENPEDFIKELRKYNHHIKITDERPSLR